MHLCLTMLCREDAVKGSRKCLEPLEVEFQIFLSCQMWVLKLNLGLIHDLSHFLAPPEARVGMGPGIALFLRICSILVAFCIHRINASNFKKKNNNN